MGAVRELREIPGVCLAEAARPVPTSLPSPNQWESWRTGLRHTVLAEVSEFVAARCADTLGACGVDMAGEILLEFVKGGKCLRSTFMYLGWLCGAPASDAALSATASLELLQAFALLQDDVMDDSAFVEGVRRRTSNSPPGIVNGDCPDRHAGSANRPPSCWATCA